MENNIFKATMRKIIGDEQPANTMNKRTQTKPPLQQTAQTSTHNPLVERHQLLFWLWAQSSRCPAPSWCWASSGIKHPLGDWICSQVRGLCCLGSTSALCSSVFSRLTIFYSFYNSRKPGVVSSMVRADDPLPTGGPLTRRVALLIAGW